MENFLTFVIAVDDKRKERSCRCIQKKIGSKFTIYLAGRAIYREEYPFRCNLIEKRSGSHESNEVRFKDYSVYAQPFQPYAPFDFYIMPSLVTLCSYFG